MKRKLMFFMTFLFGYRSGDSADVPSYRCGNRRGRWPLPVVGASVLVNGTTLGTITDIDGKFTITNVPSSSKTY